MNFAVNECVWISCSIEGSMYKNAVFLYAQVRSTELANGCREDVDTALLKLYAEQDQDCLLDLVASDNACLLAESVPWLEKYQKYNFHTHLTHTCIYSDNGRLQNL